MKTSGLIILLVFVLNITASAQKKDVNVKMSNVKWTGKKIGGSHQGEIKLKSGYILLENDQIKGGEIIIDMNSITNTDLQDDEYNKKLVGHLKSEDFFSVKNFPTSSFEVSKTTKFQNEKAGINGKLTIKGKTEMISFYVIKKENKYTATINIDRSKFDVRYGSNSFFDNLGDAAIDDIFVIEIAIVLN